MKTIGLVSCGKNKVNGTVKAKDLYIGDLFKKTRNYVEKNHDTWFILSALHGLVEPESDLAPYDFTLIGKSKKDNIKWSNKVFEVINSSVDKETIIYFYAGNEYRKNLTPLLIDSGYKVEVPMRGLGIGQQLGWLKQKLGV